MIVSIVQALSWCYRKRWQGLDWDDWLLFDWVLVRLFSACRPNILSDYSC